MLYEHGVLLPRARLFTDNTDIMKSILGQYPVSLSHLKTVATQDFFSFCSASFTAVETIAELVNCKVCTVFLFTMYMCTI